MQNDIIAEFKPDVIIFIDYPGFNMHCKMGKKSIPTHYYISPNMGLEENRITDIKRCR
jgi:lipid-A-disaccharide synthase